MSAICSIDLNLNGLAGKASGKDNLYFKKIYDAIGGKMYSLCLRYAGNKEDANDWFQEGFLKLYHYLPSFRAEGSFEGWARRIFVNACIDGVKKRNLLPVLLERIDITAPGLTGYDNLTNEDLIQCIRQLPDGYRTVVNLYLVEGYNHKEIGGMLNISEEGSRSQLFRARTLLRKKMKEV
jgi:RNA polymerase sigma factor (sigma-70 family)